MTFFRVVSKTFTVHTWKYKDHFNAETGTDDAKYFIVILNLVQQKVPDLTEM